MIPLNSSLVCITSAGSRHRLMRRKRPPPLVLSQFQGLPHTSHFLKKEHYRVDDILPQDQGHGPGQEPAYDLKLTHCVQGRTLPQPSKVACSRKHWFSIYFLKLVELGLLFCRVPPAEKLILRQYKPGLVPETNPWQGSGVTATHKKMLKEKLSFLKHFVKLANSYQPRGDESQVPH